MYESHYKYIKITYAKVLFTDTDSSLYEVKLNDVCKKFYEDKNLFYFSDYPRDSKF